MSEHLRLFDRYWDPVWDSLFGSPAYPFITARVHATIDYADGTRWVGCLYRCREGIRRTTYPDPNTLRNLTSWPEPCINTT